MELQQARRGTSSFGTNQTTFPHIMSYETRLQEIKVVSCSENCKRRKKKITSNCFMVLLSAYVVHSLREYAQTTGVLNKENIPQQGVVGVNEEINSIIHSPS